MQQEIEGSKIQADTNRDEAMTQAAAEEGVSRQELVQFANHLNQQSTAANAELRQSLERTADSHRQTIQQQTDAFARQLGEERSRQDERARITDENIRRLAESNRIPAAPTPCAQQHKRDHAGRAGFGPRDLWTELPAHARSDERIHW